VTFCHGKKYWKVFCIPWHIEEEEKEKDEEDKW
jgi:hypothetical protein